jgi:hypothetical protein
MLCCLFSVFNKKLTKDEFSSIFPQNHEFFWSCGRVVICVIINFEELLQPTASVGIKD